ncbi:MAG: MauE/DoxX family redox-associated membrane protein [Sediminicola sp.]
MKTYGPYLLKGIVALFIGLFVYTGLKKIWEGGLFYSNVRNAPLFGTEMVATFAAFAIPSLELIAAVLLFWPRTTLKGLYMALGLLTVITVYLLGLLFFGPHIPCTCRTFLPKLTWNQHLYFTVGCMLLAITAIILYRTNGRTD